MPDQIVAGGPVIFMNRTYDEAIALLVDVRDYLLHEEPRERPRLGAAERLAATLEATRLTTMLTHAIAWLLVQKAIAAGEFTREQACRPEHRLGGRSVCLVDSGVSDTRLPAGLRVLLARGQRLYARVGRLDDLLSRPVSAGCSISGRSL